MLCAINVTAFVYLVLIHGTWDCSINQHVFSRSVNSIWDTSEDIPDIPAATIQHVKNHLTQEIVEFGDDKSLLLCALEQELARGSVCHHQYSDQTDALLCHIFQAL